jgi:hypothetical protein
MKGGEGVRGVKLVSARYGAQPRLAAADHACGARVTRIAVHILCIWCS